MKINGAKTVKSLSFQGYQHEKSESGEEAYRFNCLYDHSKFDCEVQFFKVGQDKKNNFFNIRICSKNLSCLE